MLAVIGAVGQAEREAMLERQGAGIAKAKGGGPKGPCADRSATGKNYAPSPHWFTVTIAPFPPSASAMKHSVIGRWVSGTSNSLSSQSASSP